MRIRAIKKLIFTCALSSQLLAFTPCEHSFASTPRCDREIVNLSKEMIKLAKKSFLAQYEDAVIPKGIEKVRLKQRLQALALEINDYNSCTSELNDLLQCSSAQRDRINYESKRIDIIRESGAYSIKDLNALVESLNSKVEIYNKCQSEKLDKIECYLNPKMALDRDENYTNYALNGPSLRGLNKCRYDEDLRFSQLQSNDTKKPLYSSIRGIMALSNSRTCQLESKSIQTKRKISITPRSSSSNKTKSLLTIIDDWSDLRQRPPGIGKYPLGRQFIFNGDVQTIRTNEYVLFKFKHFQKQVYMKISARNGEIIESNFLKESSYNSNCSTSIKSGKLYPKIDLANNHKIPSIDIAK